MLLAALHDIIRAMRRSWSAFSSGRDVAGLVAVGHQHADVHHPAIAAQIRANAASMTTVLEVAAAAILNETTFTASIGTSGLVITAPYLGFFGSALTAPL